MSQTRRLAAILAADVPALADTISIPFLSALASISHTGLVFGRR